MVPSPDEPYSKCVFYSMDFVTTVSGRKVEMNCQAWIQKLNFFSTGHFTLHLSLILTYLIKKTLGKCL